jgi:hypothetical protein
MLVIVVEPVTLHLIKVNESRTYENEAGQDRLAFGKIMVSRI